MVQNSTLSATVELPLEPGWAVYDREGCRVGLVDEVRVDQDAFTVLQAGLVLGSLGGEFVVPRPLVAGTREHGITLTLTTQELEAHRLRRN